MRCEQLEWTVSLRSADTWSRSDAGWPAEPSEQRLLENNTIDLFCLEYKSRDAVCGRARLLESAHTMAMNMNQCGCHTDSDHADPGANEAITSAALARPHQGRRILLIVTQLWLRISCWVSAATRVSGVFESTSRPKTADFLSAATKAGSSCCETKETKAR